MTSLFKFCGLDCLINPAPSVLDNLKGSEKVGEAHDTTGRREDDGDEVEDDMLVVVTVVGDEDNGDGGDTGLKLDEEETGDKCVSFGAKQFKDGEGIGEDDGMEGETTEGTFKDTREDF